MQDQNQPNPRLYARPSARTASAMPVQRGNYGIPPRQQNSIATPAPVRPPAPQPVQQAVPQQVPSGPRMMDVTAPVRSVRPSSSPYAAPQPVPTPTATTTEHISVTAAPARQPLFTQAPIIDEQKTKPHGNERHWLPKIRLAFLVVGAILALGGAVRLVTAGNTSGHIIAVGAVAANDGKNMSIQYTADDGRLHKFTTGSNEELIPGTAVQVAYRSGAPDNSVKQVAPIEAARSLGTTLVVSSVVLLLITAASYLLQKPKNTASPSLAKPVTTPV